MVSIRLGQVGRVIPISRIAVHHIVRIKTRRPDAQSSFKIVLLAQYDRRNMPPMPKIVLIGGPVPRSSGKAPGLIGKGIVFLVAEPFQGIVTDIDPIGIPAELGAWGPVLQVVSVI